MKKTKSNIAADAAKSRQSRFVADPGAFCRGGGQSLFAAILRPSLWAIAGLSSLGGSPSFIAFRALLGGVVAVGLMVSLPSASAQTMYLSMGTNSYEVEAGGSITLSIYLVNTSPSLDATGYSYALKASSDGVFTLTSRELFVLDDFTSGNAATDYPVSMTGTVDLGATWNLVDSVPVGTTLVQTVILQVGSGVTDGAYTFSLFLGPGGPGVDDSDFNTYLMSSLLTVSVNVVPEPSSGLLLSLSGGILLLCGSRNRVGKRAKLSNIGAVPQWTLL